VALRDERQLPAEVVGVADAGVHPLAAGGDLDVCGVPDENTLPTRKRSVILRWMR
jgi:hypothetical protein